MRRNAVDFKQILNEALSTFFTHTRKQSFPEQFSNWPTVAIYNACYNEDIGFARQTVVGALGIEYSKDLLQIYLCDNGKDDGKLDMILALRLESGSSNLHYFVSSDNSHSKARTLNYSLSITDSDLTVLSASVQKMRLSSKLSLPKRANSSYFLSFPICD